MSSKSSACAAAPLARPAVGGESRRLVSSAVALPSRSHDDSRLWSAAMPGASLAAPMIPSVSRISNFAVRTTSSGRSSYRMAAAAVQSPALSPSILLVVLVGASIAHSLLGLARRPGGHSRRLIGSIAAGNATRDEGPAEMVAMAFEQQPTLSGRASRVEARNDRARLINDFELRGYLEPAIGEDHIALHRAERIERRLQRRRRVGAAASLIASIDRSIQRGGGYAQRTGKALDRIGAVIDIVPITPIVFDISIGNAGGGRHEVWPGRKLLRQPLIEHDKGKLVRL